MKTAGQAITDALLKLPEFKTAHTVFCYVSFGREVDTHAFISAALATGKRVCVPKTQSGGSMQAHQITSLQMLRPAPFGLVEPPESTPLVSPQKIDLVVVPCLACDEMGRRLGYGKGYYDRYLPKTKGAAVCLCYGRLLQKQLPTAANDVPMRTILTEKKVLRV